MQSLDVTPPHSQTPRCIEVWRYADRSAKAPDRLALADTILSSLRAKSGGILYSKRTKENRQLYYVDRHLICYCDMVPLNTQVMDPPGATHTEIGGGMVRKEALDLLGYSYDEMSRGHFSVVGDLKFVSEHHSMSSPGRTY